MSMESYQTPRNTKHQPKTSDQIQNAQSRESLLSPRFRSAAAMAGWDEETLLLATFVVEDTPERESGHKKRPRVLVSETSATSSREKRRARRQSGAPSPAVVINIDHNKENVGLVSRYMESPTTTHFKAAKKILRNLKVVAEKQAEDVNKVEETKRAEEKRDLKAEEACPSATSSLPCIDRLREELSCAICLEICFEPSTTPCGHSFCKKCLKSAADKCGKKCPKCRQQIGNGRSCTVNTVLWNTIQLLFPAEVEARKRVAMNASQSKQESPKTNINRRGNVTYNSRNMVTDSRPRRTTMQSEEEDAALALRLQREEFMEVFQESNEEMVESGERGGHFRWASEWNQPRNHLNSSRARLRAMASTLNPVRVRGRPI